MAATAFFQSDCLQLSDFREYIISTLKVGINYEPKRGTHSHLGSEMMPSLVSVMLVALFSCPDLLSVEQQCSFLILLQ